MKRAKSLITIIGTVSIALLLSGCSTLQRQKAEKQKEIQSQCNNTDVLLSDLTKPVGKRVYSLQPGVVCND